jgi:hypothetical protein
MQQDNFNLLVVLLNTFYTRVGKIHAHALLIHMCAVALLLCVAFRWP